MRVILIAAFLILVNGAGAFGQMSKPHRGSRVRDVTIEIENLMQAQDTVQVTATWVSKNNFAERYLWRVAALGLSGNVELLTASFPVAQQAVDVPASFCVKAKRVSDGRESTEICQGFVIPAADVVLPPDSLNVQVVMTSFGQNFMTAKWDTVPGAYEYFASLETAAGEVGRFPFGSIRETPTAQVNQPIG